MAAEAGKGEQDGVHRWTTAWDSPLKGSPHSSADVELQAPEDAITSLAFHPSDPNRLLVSSWDAVRAISLTDT